MTKWETVDLYKESYLASNKIYHTPQNEYTKIRYIEAFCSPDYKKRYVEINTTHEEHHNFLKALQQDRELSELVGPQVSQNTACDSPFTFHIQNETKPSAIDKQQRQLWKFLHIANKFTSIDNDIIEDISKTTKVDIPGTVKIPSLSALYSREITGRTQKDNFGLQKKQESYKNMVTEDRQTEHEPSPSI